MPGKKNERASAAGHRGKNAVAGKFVNTAGAKEARATTTKESVPLPGGPHTIGTTKEKGAHTGYRSNKTGQYVTTEHGKTGSHFGKTSTKTSNTPLNRALKDKAAVLALLHELPVDWMLEGLRLRVLEDNRSEPMLEYLTSKGDRAKPGIERASGLSLSTEEAADVLGKTAETVRSYINNKQVVGYRAATDQTKIRLPQWQFAENGLHDWVPRLIEAFGDNGWSLLDFVTVARSNIEGGQNYLDLLRGGNVEEVIAAAGRANPD